MEQAPPSPSLKAPLVRVQGLEVIAKGRYDLHFFTLLQGLSYSIEEGEILGIVGESGCGKTLLSLSLMGILPPRVHLKKGSFFFEGQDLFQCSEEEYRQIRGKDMAMVFQEPMSAFNPILTIGEQIEEQIQTHLPYLSSSQRKERVLEMLHSVELPSPDQQYRNYPHQLSGGMRQRAMIAMALSCKPKFLIADEPTTALDVTVQAQIVHLLQKLQRQLNMSVQFITHDIALIYNIAQRVLILYAGELCEMATTQDLFNHPRHPYTRALLQCLPQGHASSQRDKVTSLPTIEGQSPSREERFKGCPFYARCPRAQEICQQKKPPLQEVNSAKWRHERHAVACFFPLEAPTPHKNRVKAPDTSTSHR